MAVVVIAGAGPHHRHRVTGFVQVHVAGVAFACKVVHGLQLAGEMARERVGIARGDLDEPHGRAGAGALSRHAGQRVAVQPHQLPVLEHVALPQRAQGATQAFLSETLEQLRN
ncbi:hypothetical protein D3C77_684700 [compost metagenome]